MSTPADIIPCDHRNDTRPPIELLRALSGPAVPEPPLVEFLTLADAGGMTVAMQGDGDVWFWDAAEQEFTCISPIHEGDA